jgi:cytochrome o ubiquinol oxidase subunit IV
MSDDGENRPQREQSIAGVVLDALLTVLTLGVIVWFRAARAQHGVDRDGASAAAADHSAAYRSALCSYLSGFGLAVLLTLLPFSCVAWSGFSRDDILWIIAGAAVVQIAVHLRFFLHVDLTQAQREDVQFIVFSFLIVAMMAGGTIWILGNLRYRMM